MNTSKYIGPHYSSISNATKKCYGFSNSAVISCLKYF